MSKIIAVQAKRQVAPLKHAFKTAKHAVAEVESIQVVITLEDGRSGHGAATANEVVTGDTAATTLAVIEAVLKPRLIDQELADFNRLLEVVHHAIRHNAAAKAAVEIALYDLQAQGFGVSLTQLLGGLPMPVATDFTIGIAPIAAMVAAAEAKVAAGFTALKIKLGTAPLVEDLARVEAIASAVGPEIHLRLDANQAWSAKTAIQASRQLAASGLLIDFIEQPVAASDMRGLATVTAASPLPIMADECVHSVQDAQKVIALCAADYINIKLMKTGGISEAVKIDALCAANGIACMLGCMIESQVSLAAAVALAASHPNIRFVDLDAIYMSEEALAAPFLKTAGPELLLQHQVGL